MALTQEERFYAWRKRLKDPKLAYLADQVVEKIMPIFTGYKYGWGNPDPKLIVNSAIFLQKRKGPNWPSFQFSLLTRRGASMIIYFDQLPEVCFTDNFHTKSNKPDTISREKANIFGGYGAFVLEPKPNRGGMWGSRTIFFWKKRIDEDIRKLGELLPDLLGILDSGIPVEWYIPPEDKWFLPHVHQYLFTKPEFRADYMNEKALRKRFQYSS